ncbi:ATP-binding protein [Streptomyces sp. HD]|uniref:ATP-binding protein n=1 Tax=Streptomyces sp. HD TaxID=3020892 RepID=UPI00232BC903|nr:ATP-binding protein [Streptomyces sp. HD]MDC0770247.1 ATP-binding protein [Streptomyces sp. HD]
MEYDAARIEVLEGREAVRKRPGMWVGSVTERGLHQLVFEVVGRAVNEVSATGAGRAGAGRVDVTLMSDGGVRVADDGPGAAFEAPAAGDVGSPGLEALLTSMCAGSEPSGQHLVGVGHFGVGLFVANALSSWLTAEVRREGVRRTQEYARGVALAPPALIPTALTPPALTPTALTPPSATGPATGSGTTLAFWPDAGIFETTSCSFAVLAERFRQVAFLNRGLEISLTDERPAGGARVVRFRFPDGVRDFVSALDAEAGASLHPDVIGFEREDPRMAGTMEVAFLWSGTRWNGSREERVRGFANSRATPQGGTHVDGFRDGVAAAVTSYARKRGLLTAVEVGPGPVADRIGEGLTAVVSVKLDRPEFLGATIGLLGNPEVRACVGEAVRECLDGWFEEHPERAAEIVDRIARGTTQD